MSTIPCRSTRVDAVVKSVLGTAVAVPLLFSAMPAMAQSQQDEMRQLKQQMQQMQQRFEQLQAKQDKQAAMARNQQSAGGAKAEASVSDSGMELAGTKFELSGYLKLDAVYDFDNDHGASLGPSDPIQTRNDYGTDSPDNQDLGATARQTRLVLNTTTPTAIGDVGGYIEADLFGNGGSFGSSLQPRIRRAYVTVGNWLIGRDWTTFSDFNYGTMLNFYGPQAQTFERQA